MSKSLKKHVIQSFAKISDIKGMEKNKVILTTAAGLISGRLSSEEALSSKEAFLSEGAVSSEQALGVYGIILNTIRETFDDEVNGNDGYILLTDAVIRNQSTNYNLGNIVIFYDQIIGISIGTMD